MSDELRVVMRRIDLLWVDQGRNRVNVFIRFTAQFKSFDHHSEGMVWDNVERLAVGPFAPDFLPLPIAKH